VNLNQLKSRLDSPFCGISELSDNFLIPLMSSGSTSPLMAGQGRAEGANGFLLMTRKGPACLRGVSVLPAQILPF